MESTEIEVVKKPRAVVLYEIEIDMRDLPAGVYYCVLRTRSGTYATKLIKL